MSPCQSLKIARGHREDARRRPPRGGAPRLPRRRTSQAGITTGELDRIAHDYQVNVQDVIPATLNYAPPGHSPYPASICTSVNHVVCHGIPGDKKLKAGDIVNIDVTVIKDGWHGDTSRMFYVGAPSIQARRLVEITYEAMWRGIRAVRARRAARRHRPHDPEVRREPRLLRRARVLRPRHRARSSTRSRRCCTTAGRAPACVLQPGMIFTIEPMINAGRAAIRASPTAGRSSPRTIRCPRSGSTRCW